MSLKKPQMTLTGNLTADPRTLSADPPRTAFGLATNPDRYDAASEQWVPDGDVQFYDVVCFGALARNVGESVRKGDPVIVVGTLRRRAWQRTDGTQEVSHEIAADAVGPDLGKGTTLFRKSRRPDAVTGTRPRGDDAAPAQDAEGAGAEFDEARVDLRTGELLDA